MKRHLMICGLGRSGTTAFTEILSSHGQIVLGMERFKRLSRPGAMKRFTPDLFRKASFFNFEDGLTNITPEKNVKWLDYYNLMKEKFDAAVYVGDKIDPGLIENTRRQFPADTKYLYIVRKIFDVALSWDLRARKGQKGWPAARDARRSVHEWNKALETLQAHHSRFPETMRHVEYDSFFSDPSGERLNALLAFLELEPDDAIRDSFRAHHAYYMEKLAPRSRELPPADREYIEAHADFALWDRVTQAA